MGKKVWEFEIVYVYQDYNPDDPNSPYIYFDHPETGLKVSFSRPEAEQLGIFPGEPAALVLLTGDNLENLENQPS